MVSPRLQSETGKASLPLEQLREAGTSLDSTLAARCIGVRLWLIFADVADAPPNEAFGYGVVTA